MPLAQGDRAKIKAPVITGDVISVKYDENTGEKKILLAWEDASGAQERWFKEDELEAAAV